MKNENVAETDGEREARDDDEELTLRLEVTECVAVALGVLEEEVELDADADLDAEREGLTDSDGVSETRGVFEEVEILDAERDILVDAVSEVTPLAEGDIKEDLEYVAEEEDDRDRIGDRELDAEVVCDIDSEALPVVHREFLGDEETDGDKDDVRETNTVDDTEEEPEVVTEANFAVEEIVLDTVGDKLPLGDGETERDGRGEKDALGE